MKKSIVVAVAGVIAALSLVLLEIGAVMWLFAYLMPLVCGVLMIVLTESVNKKTALLVYTAVSILSLAVLPDKECALVYVFFFGYYPIIRSRMDAVSSSALRAVLKFAVFNLGMLAAQLLSIYVFGIPLDTSLGKWAIPVTAVLFNLLFLVYEKLLGVLLILYARKFKSRIDKYLK